ncbi:unnamed protein product [Schistosoma margrebowiei]|uniref:Uncharacterized protein n=1 Tax=Schistosoma margrebowiei TaxID=48269 RepID=A0A183NCU3_9TREM|nr:unnamed protein product [Schistosoma margrebowiei]
MVMRKKQQTDDNLCSLIFINAYLSNEVVLQTEQSDDPIQKTADFDSTDIDSEAERLLIMSKPSSTDQAQSLSVKNSPSVQKGKMFKITLYLEREMSYV